MQKIICEFTRKGPLQCLSVPHLVRNRLFLKGCSAPLSSFRFDKEHEDIFGIDISGSDGDDISPGKKSPFSALKIKPRKSIDIPDEELMAKKYYTLYEPYQHQFASTWTDIVKVEVGTDEDRGLDDFGDDDELDTFDRHFGSIGKSKGSLEDMDTERYWRGDTDEYEGLVAEVDVKEGDEVFMSLNDVLQEHDDLDEVRKLHIHEKKHAFYIKRKDRKYRLKNRRKRGKEMSNVAYAIECLNYRHQSNNKPPPTKINYYKD